MNRFTYGEINFIFLAFVMIFCTFAGLVSGSGPGILLFLPVAGAILYLAYRKLKS